MAKGWTDDEVVRAVADIRGTTGVCSYRSLASRLGLSVTGVRSRVDRLVGVGRLLSGPEAGAIRLNIPPQVFAAIATIYVEDVPPSPHMVSVLVDSTGAEVIDLRSRAVVA